MHWKLGLSSISGSAVAALGALALASLAVPAGAHHSYAMFDMNKAMAREGRVAKLDWTNPHISLWLYVPKAGQQGQYDLWRFQSDAPAKAARAGWSKSVFEVGERITIHYFPLRDGAKGGYVINVVRADGSELIGDRDAPGVAQAQDKLRSSRGAR